MKVEGKSFQRVNFSAGGVLSWWTRRATLVPPPHVNGRNRRHGARIGSKCNCPGGRKVVVLKAVSTDLRPPTAVFRRLKTFEPT